MCVNIWEGLANCKSGATDESLWPLVAGLVQPSLTDEISRGRRGAGNGMMEVSDNSSKNPIFCHI